MSMQELLVQKNKRIESARTAALTGDLASAKSLRVEAEGFQARIDELTKLDSMAEANKSFASPVPLPTGNGAAAHIDAAYVRRFGTVEDSIKGILVDLHGNGYQQLYHEQRMAFKSYLRRGEQGLGAENFRKLKEIVLTPTAVKMALDQGMDDVALIKATMVEAIGTLGGFAVPVDFQNRILERLKADTVVRSRAMVGNTSRDTVEIPVGTGGDDQYSSAVRVTWVDETPTAGQAATNLTFGMESIPIHTVMAEAFLSRNMVEDSMFDVEGYLVEKMSEASEIDEDNRYIIGSGIGSPQGVLPGGSNLLNLTRKPSGDASVLTWNGLIAMSYAIPERYRRNAVWVAKRSTYEEIRKLTQGDNYLWSPDQTKGGQDANPMKLLGYPIVEQESMPAVAAGSYPIVFGDFKGYSIFDRVGMTVERFLDGSTARTNQILFVMRRRLGGQPTETWRFATQQVAAT